MAKSPRKRTSAIGAATTSQSRLPDSVRAEPLHPEVAEGPIDSSVPRADLVKRSSLGDMSGELPLGGAFWTLQFAQAVSLIADGGLLWSLLWWLMNEGKSSGIPVTSLLGISPYWTLLVLPLLGAVGDRLPRKVVLSGSLGLRAIAQFALAVLLVTKRLSVEALLGCQIISLVGTVAFEVTCPSTVPSLVTASQAPRALGYGLSLPRAGFFLTSVFCLLFVAIVGPLATLVTGLGFLVLATALIHRLAVRQEPADRWPILTLPRQIFDGVRVFLQTPGVLWMGTLAALANFVMYPLFALTPHQRLQPHQTVVATHPVQATLLGNVLPTTPPPQEQHDLEFWLVVGVVVGAALLQRRLRAVSTDRIFAASLLWMALGIGVLAIVSSQTLAFVGTVLAGIALMPLSALTAGVSLLGVSDGYRARIASLLGVFFLAGGELGQLVLRPLFQQHGVRPMMLAITTGLLLLGLGLVSVQDLPRMLRSPLPR